MHLMANPGDRQYATEAINIVRENPGVKWSVAFKAAKADSLPQATQAAQEEGKQQAYESIQNKQDATSFHQSQRGGDVEVKDIIAGIKTGRVPLSEAKKIINSIS